MTSLDSTLKARPVQSAADARGPSWRRLYAHACINIKCPTRMPACPRALVSRAKCRPYACANYFLKCDEDGSGGAPMAVPCAVALSVALSVCLCGYAMLVLHFKSRLVSDAASATSCLLGLLRCIPIPPPHHMHHPLDTVTRLV